MEYHFLKNKTKEKSNKIHKVMYTADNIKNKCHINRIGVARKII